MVNGHICLPLTGDLEVLNLNEVLLYFMSVLFVVFFFFTVLKFLLK